MQFTSDQARAIQAVLDFVKSKKDLITLGGYSGTGKTTTISHSMSLLRSIKRHKHISIAYCCFTGKASTVLFEKLRAAKSISGNTDYCGTIHGLIYKPVKDARGNIIMWEKAFKIPYDLIVIDEASMVGDNIFEDLRSYGIPIIAVGDHGQLPPVFSKFNLMENPMIRLETIHRQAEGNPIIKLSMMARCGEVIPTGKWAGPGGEQVEKTETRGSELIKTLPRVEDWMILAGRNSTRTAVNGSIRAILGRSGPVTTNERVICLKNNRQAGIYNGMVGIIKSVQKVPNPDFLNVKVEFDISGLNFHGDIFLHQFGNEKTLRGWKDWKTRKEYLEMDLRNLFDFGYALTVHKSQGSQADNVLLIDERMSAMSDENYNRWVYTGITRSSKNLIISAA